MTPTPTIPVFGDLASTGKFTSWSQDLTGGTAGQLTGEWTELFADIEKPPATFGQLPKGVPQKMSVESYRDTREGALWKRTFKLVADVLPESKDSQGIPPRDQKNPVYGLQVTLEDLPLKVHPNINHIIDYYGGYEDADGLKFPRKLPQVASVGTMITGLTGAGNTSKDNPMYGRTTYKSAAVVFTAKWLWLSPDASQPWPSQISAPGIINTPQKAPSYDGKNGQKRDWLYLGMSTRMTGKLHEIEESWLLSQAGGWNVDIYGAAALAKKY